MGDENKIDKLFKSNLENFDISPPEKLKMAIDKNLEHQRYISYKRKAGYYQVAAIILGFLLISLGGYILMPFNEEAVKEKNVIEENDRSNNNSIIENIKEKKNDDSFSSGKDKNNVIIKRAAEIEIIKNDQKNNIAAQKSETQINNKNISFNNSSIELNNDNPIQDINDDNATIVEHLQEVEVNENSLNESSLSDANVVNSTGGGKNEISGNLIAKGSPLSMALFFSPNYSYCRLTDNSDNLIDDVAMYNEREDSEFSYTTGLQFRYELSDRFGISSGLSFSSVVKSISVLTVYATRNEADNIYYEYSTSSGSLELESIDSKIPNEGDSLKINNPGIKELRYLNIPIAARYKIKNNKFLWFASAGVSVNFLLADKVTLNIENSEKLFSNETQGLEKMYYGFMAGAGFEYNLFSNMSVLVEPVFKGAFTSITKNTAVNSYPYSFGTNLGIVFDF